MVAIKTRRTIPPPPPLPAHWTSRPPNAERNQEPSGLSVVSMSPSAWRPDWPDPGTERAHMPGVTQSRTRGKRPHQRPFGATHLDGLGGLDGLDGLDDGLQACRWQAGRQRYAQRRGRAALAEWRVAESGGRPRTTVPPPHLCAVYRRRHSKCPPPLLRTPPGPPGLALIKNGFSRPPRQALPTRVKLERRARRRRTADNGAAAAR